MKQTILSTAVTIALLWGTTGCGNSNTGHETSQQGQETASKVSLQKRKKAFDTKIQAFSAYGFDVNKTSEKTYLLTVKDEKKALDSLLKTLYMSTLDKEAKAPLEKMLKGSKFGVDIDWNKYAANEKESVFVYYLGNGKEDPATAKILTGKKMAAYLTYNGQDQLKQVKVKDMDETITDKTSKSRILLKNMHADIKKLPTETSTERMYDIYGGTLNYEITDTEINSTLSFEYQDFKCHVNKSNAYLGEETCTFPKIDISAKINTAIKSPTQDEINLHLLIDNISWIYHVSAHNKKVKGDIDFKIDSVLYEEHDPAEKTTMLLKDIKIVGNTDNLDESILKSYMALLNNPPKDSNETMMQMMSFIGKIYGTGMTFDYTVSVASAKGESDDITYALDAYKGHGKGSFDSTINYKERSSVKSIMVAEKKSNKPVFDLKNFRFGYGISDLHNFIPAFMELSGAAATLKGGSQTAQSAADLKKKLTDMGMNTVHNGFGIALDPVGWDTLQADVNGKAATFGKADLNIHARLKKNDLPIDINSPMSAMMLIPYFQADGKLVLRKKDLEQLSKTVPPQMIGMLMMYAKYEGENAVFVLKFENGHLMINGKPVM